MVYWMCFGEKICKVGCQLTDIFRRVTWSQIQWYRMSMALDRFCLTVLFAMPTAQLLSDVIWIVCCGYPRSMAVCMMLVAACPTMKAAAYSASTADEATVGNDNANVGYCCLRYSVVLVVAKVDVSSCP